LIPSSANASCGPNRLNQPDRGLFRIFLIAEIHPTAIWQSGGFFVL
jgi:hypothetical protein